MDEALAYAEAALLGGVLGVVLGFAQFGRVAKQAVDLVGCCPDAARPLAERSGQARARHDGRVARAHLPCIGLVEGRLLIANEERTRQVERRRKRRRVD